MNDPKRYDISAIGQEWHQRELAIYCGDAQICHCGVWSDDWNTAYAMARHIADTHNATLLPPQPPAIALGEQENDDGQK